MSVRMRPGTCVSISICVGPDPVRSAQLQCRVKVIKAWLVPGRHIEHLVIEGEEKGVIKIIQRLEMKQTSGLRQSKPGCRYGAALTLPSGSNVGVNLNVWATSTIGCFILTYTSTVATIGE
ncbi:hypothetical protein BU17DRAFT_68813 [Hysterangium stoloniferum]|nr:hypothetical protein BU17DRAFT_68813 [Hysterangium stoloniferum]